MQGHRSDIQSADYPDLTLRQAETLRTLRDHISRLGCAPTIKELSALMGLCPVGANRLLTELEYRGYITRLRGRWRGVYLTPKGEGRSR